MTSQTDVHLVDPDRGAAVPGAAVAHPSPTGPSKRRGGWLGDVGFSLRERVQATTGLGLSPRRGRLAPVRGTVRGAGSRPDISFLAAGETGGRPVLFIHGTPGDATDWLPFVSNPGDGEWRIAVDRPGFGASGPGAPVVTLREQAGAIAAVLEGASAPAVVVGSSYGGPVALRLAADHPDAVASVLLVGAAADPAAESTHPLQRLAAVGAVARRLPRALAHANAELLALRGELETLAGVLGQVRAPVTILHGLRDTLVPVRNADYMAEKLAGAARRRIVLVEKAGHFLHILAHGLVEAGLADVIAEAKTAPQRPATP